MDHLQSVIFSLLVLGCRATDQNARIYSSSEACSAGAYHDVYQYEPDLSIIGFDDTIESVTIHGVWIFYEHYNYNPKWGAVQLSWGDNHCLRVADSLSNQVSSMRYAGRQDSLNADTFTLYEGTWFTGTQVFEETQISNLHYFNDMASSVIITGNSPWTFFADIDFGGQSICLYPSDAEIGIEVVNIGYAADLGDSEYHMNNKITSVLKGCFSDDVIYLPPNKSNDQLSKSSGGEATSN